VSLIHHARAAVRNAFLSKGARLFGWRFSIDYLRIAARVAARWGSTGPGEMRLLGFRVPYPNQSHAFALLHEVFVNAPYTFRRRPRPRIIDCGANIGCSLIFFKACAPDASIVAIEAASATFECLQDVVAVNGLRDVELIHAAVGGRDGTVTLYTAPHDVGGITASVDAAWGGAVAEEVRGIRLSSLIDAPVDFVKLDVEGAEYDVVSDLDATGRLALVREMTIECHNLAGRPGARAALVAQLERAGMRVAMTGLDRPSTTAIVHAERPADA
jgi:FkbM family methyltransferase